MSKLLRITPETLANNPRASLNEWLRFSHIVKDAMLQHPQSFFYKPETMSPNTLESRIRDAIRGCICFSYDPNSDAIRTWFNEVIFSHTKTLLIIGPKKKQGSPPIEGTQSNKSKSSVSYSYPSLTQHEYNAFITLLAANHINGPVIVDDPKNLELSDSPFVESLIRPDGKLIIL